LKELNRLSRKEVTSYQPFWALQGKLLSETGNFALASEAYVTAIGLTEDEATRRYLRKKVTIQQRRRPSGAASEVSTLRAS
jgi:RNA polymerase sigma-70 factor (ECF subfamily)